MEHYYYSCGYLLLYLAGIFPAIFIVAASYGGCDRVFVVISFTLAMGFMGNFYPGLKVNSLDLSPNYAGTLMAITNGAGALSGIAAPSFVGFMAPNVILEKIHLTSHYSIIIQVPPFSVDIG